MFAAASALFAITVHPLASNKPVLMTAASVPVSASVLLTLMQTDSGIELLVLWRGSPKWWMGARQEPESYSGSDRDLTAILPFGSQRLILRYTAESRTVTIQGRSINLPPDSNVVFVDHVDVANALSIKSAGTLLRSESPVDVRGGSLADVLRNSPEIAAFLRCDNPDEYHLGRVVCDALKR